MELVEGTDLKKIIREVGGALPVDRVLHLAIQMCSGIGYAHRSGLVHADVKPQNILVTGQDVVKVTDFGIAQALSDTQPNQRADVVWGSPHYFAPEQARGEQPTPAADVYALGIVTFEMLTGRLPYSGANQQELALAHIREPIPMVTQFNPNVSDRLAKMIYRAMSKDPRDRFRDADQFGNVLRGYRDTARDQTVTNQPPVEVSAPQPSRPPQAEVPPKPASNEVTAKYSAAPEAPKPYDPRASYGNQRPSVPNPVTQAPQPFEQRYVAPSQQATDGASPQYTPASYPPPPQQGTDSGYYAPHSQPIMIDEHETEGLDIVTMILAFLALLSVGGLIPLWIFVFASR